MYLYLALLSRIRWLLHACFPLEPADPLEKSLLLLAVQTFTLGFFSRIPSTLFESNSPGGTLPVAFVAVWPRLAIHEVEHAVQEGYV